LRKSVIDIDFIESNFLLSKSKIRQAPRCREQREKLFEKKQEKSSGKVHSEDVYWHEAKKSERKLIAHFKILANN
jgi:hypothetical protein